MKNILYRTGQKVFCAIGLALYYIFPFLRNIPLKNLRMIKTFSNREDYNRCVKKFFCGQLINIFECIFFYFFPEEILKKVNYDENEMKRVFDSLKDLKGAVFLSLHYGNWELLGAFFIKLGFPLSSIYMKPRHKFMDYLFNFWRRKHRIGLVEHDNPMGIIRVIKKGRILALLSDQDGGPSGIMTEWLGNKVSFPAGAARIYSKFRLPVFGTFIERLPNGSHKVIIKKIEISEDDTDLKSITDNFIDFYKDTISRIPSQWLLFYDRFKFRTYKRNINSSNKYTVFSILLDVFYFLFITLFSPYIIFLLASKNALRMNNVFQWLGIYNNYKGSGPLLIHVVSFGEYSNIEFLIDEEKDIVLSTPDVALFDFLYNKFKTHQNVTIILSPLDFSYCIKAMLLNFKPKKIIFSEVDLWPNLLIQIRKIGIKVYWINARISNKNNLLFKCFPLYRSLLKGINIYPKDKTSIKYLKDSKISSNGIVNLKFVKKTTSDDEWAKKINECFAQKKIIVLGSSHREDENVFFDAVSSFSREKYAYIIVPRDISRASDIRKTAQNKGFSAVVVKRISDIKHDDLLVVEKMGVLSQIYKACDIAVVGGSFLDLGAHNILEPAFYEKKVITGPFIRNFKDEAELLVALEILKISDDVLSLRENIQNWIGNPDFKGLFRAEKENMKKIKELRLKLKENEDDFY